MPCSSNTSLSFDAFAVRTITSSSSAIEVCSRFTYADKIYSNLGSKSYAPSYSSKLAAVKGFRGVLASPLTVSWITLRFFLAIISVDSF